MELVQYYSFSSHVASGPWKYGQCEWESKFLILFNFINLHFHLSSCMLQVATLLDSSVLEYKNVLECQLREGRTISAVFPAVASASQVVSGVWFVLRK